jgi:uncharacterized protein YcnI
MTSHRKIARLVVLPAAVVGFSALAIGPALAHVTISPGEADANSYFVATVAVPHGCDGSATTSITIKMPKELVEVTPTRNALWDVTKTTAKLAKPITAEDGDEITEKVDTVVYTARTPLPDGYRDAFELNFQVPDQVGKTLLFPTIQKCEKGQTAWVEEAAAGQDEPAHPAPSVKIVAGDVGDAVGLVRSTSEESDGTPAGLAFGALGVGIVALLLGGAAFAKSRKA